MDALLKKKGGCEHGRERGQASGGSPFREENENLKIAASEKRGRIDWGDGVRENAVRKGLDTGKKVLAKKS